MPLAPVNNPPAPVQEAVGVAVPVVDPCAEIKAEFDIKTGSHGSLKGKVPSTHQRHHILQDAAVSGAGGLIGYSAGMCIGLEGGSASPGTEHWTANKAQNDRIDNKSNGSGGPTPAVTFGQLKDLSKEDVSKALQAGNRKSNKTGKPMTPAQADQIADCVVAEAEAKVKKDAQDKGKPPPTDSTTQGIKPPKGCLAYGTLVWLANGDLVAVQDLRPGDWVQTTSGPQVIVRVDGCHHDLVEIDLGDDVLTVASFHRVLLPDGSPRRASDLRAGDSVSAIGGPRVVADRRRLGPQREPVYRIGFRGQVACAIGRAGIWTLMPEAGPRVDREESVVPFVAQEEQACPS